MVLLVVFKHLRFYTYRILYFKLHKDKMKCSWKEASTLILTTLRKGSGKSDWNYDLLTTQRSSKSSFMPNGCVFPGGVCEPSDSDKKWLDYFSFFNLDLSNEAKLSGKIPEIIANQNGEIPKLISLKITALREVFEETGVLLCFKKNQSAVSQKWVSYNTFKDLDLWRLKVQNDAKEFFNMCQSNDFCPDITNLYLWSNWITPTSMGSKRFDAAFFIACSKESPVAVADNTEIENLNWVTPNQLLKLCKTQNLWLPPPQVYETSRLLNFKDIKSLSDFAVNRCIHGCERWMPIQKKTLNGMVSILPGDGAYNVSDYCTLTELDKINMTTEEFREQSQVLHRMEFPDKVKTKVVVKNYKPTCGHVLPIGEC